MIQNRKSAGADDVFVTLKNISIWIVPFSVSLSNIIFETDICTSRKFKNR